MAHKPQDYETYLAKFKRKPTSDDTFTPPNVYEAVKGWAVREYHLEGRPVVRPFWPDGDYEKLDYPKGCVVIDNPPFSILAKIIRFYLAKGIDFFLFAPGITALSYGRFKGINILPISCNITYLNGAKVSTCFLTTLGNYVIDTAPSLRRDILATSTHTPKPKKITYPPNVITSTDCGFLSTHGVRFRVKKDNAIYMFRLDKKRSYVFGSYFLLSDRAAADRAAAERAAAERAAAERYELSERELELVKKLSTPK